MCSCLSVRSQDVDVTKLGMPRVLYVYVTSDEDGVALPAAVTAEEWTESTQEALTEHAHFAGLVGLFFLDTPAGCEQCVSNRVRLTSPHPALARASAIPILPNDSVPPGPAPLLCCRTIG